MSRMLLPDVRNHTQKLADATASHELEMRRAARTVRARVPESAARQELLECLGLLDATRPPGAS